MPTRVSLPRENHDTLVLSDRRANLPPDLSAQLSVIPQGVTAMFALAEIDVNDNLMKSLVTLANQSLRKSGKSITAASAARMRESIIKIFGAYVTHITTVLYSPPNRQDCSAVEVYVIHTTGRQGKSLHN